VAIYGRVSTDDRSYERQQRDLRAIAPALVIVELGFAAELGCCA
jgi:DNA invertase Pin-like site-specific DNA recombinase